LHMDRGYGIRLLCVVSLRIYDRRQEGVMEVAELKTMIGELEARVDKIRDWL